MVVTAVEATLESVVDKLEELAAPQELDYEDILAEQPGPEQTGEFGFTLEVDEDEES